MTEDFYDLLGVESDASQEEIRKAFRRQVRVYHPDLNDDPRAPAQFTALKKAYDTLGDPKERDDYDRMGHESYVAKRINGLPSPEEWEIPEKEFGGGEAGTSRDAGTTGSGSETAGATGTSDATATGAEKRRRRERSRTGADSSTAKSAGSNGAGDGKRGRSARTAGANAGGHGTGARNGAASATATGTSGGTARRSTGTSGGESDARSGSLGDAVGRIRDVSLGWPLIALSDSLYLAGLAIYIADNAAETNRLVERLVAAALGPGSIREVLGTSNGIVPLSEYIVTVVTAESVIGGVFLILGMAFLPSVYFFIIRETRRIRTPWQPSYLYVLGAMGPVVGLVLNATTEFPGLYLDVVCYVVLPLGSIVGLPFSAFVRPRLRRSFRKTVRRFTD